MRKFTAFLVAVWILGASMIVMAGATATQTVTYSVSAINELSVSGDPPSLTVSTATAGSAPITVTTASTRYAVTTNMIGSKITGAIDTAMPTGVTLAVSLAQPAGGTSAGTVTLTDTPQDLVTNITRLNETGKTITYALSAASNAGVVPSAAKSVTLTISAP